ncbi:hypothetical protein C7B80_25900 [Cyanosarcina cf. burmensis CCALA 770]|nr:hypothetical protein C7B80_25900 [Cyanosarcina cf. burmensis CCALA 770]
MAYSQAFGNFFSALFSMHSRAAMTAGTFDNTCEHHDLYLTSLEPAHVLMLRRARIKNLSDIRSNACTSAARSFRLKICNLSLTILQYSGFKFGVLPHRSLLATVDGNSSRFQLL